MSDARQSPIPQDRVNENVDQRQRAADARRREAEQERYLRDQARGEQREGDSATPAASDDD